MERLILVVLVHEDGNMNHLVINEQIAKSTLVTLESGEKESWYNIFSNSHTATSNNEKAWETLEDALIHIPCNRKRFPPPYDPQDIALICKYHSLDEEWKEHRPIKFDTTKETIAEVFLLHSWR